MAQNVETCLVWTKRQVGQERPDILLHESQNRGHRCARYCGREFRKGGVRIDGRTERLNANAV